ncbi:MAG: transcriptional repressor [Myxococcales bacterium]|nr:transcriptional repressor [Myxococcales bacterium]
MRHQGLKFTQQRRLITEVFFDPDLRDEHPSTEELYLRVRARDARVGYATVYRTLKLLVDAGLANPTRFGDKQVRYEPEMPGEHHDHLVCQECGAVLEFEEHAIEALQEAVAAKFGFALTDHRMVLYGKPKGACDPAFCKRQETVTRVGPSRG